MQIAALTSGSEIAGSGCRADLPVALVRRSGLIARF